MNSPTDPVLDFLGKAMSQSDAVDAADAEGWVVLSICQEYGDISVSGIFASEMEAVVGAEVLHTQVHRGWPKNEPGWKMLVRPILPYDSKGPVD